VKYLHPASNEEAMSSSPFTPHHCRSLHFSLHWKFTS
jgi:hypothetical protein